MDYKHATNCGRESTGFKNKKGYQLNLSIPLHLASEIKKDAKRRGLSIAAVVRVALENAMGK